MNFVVLDGYALNPGDLSWADMEALGNVTVYDRTSPEEVIERASGAEIVLTNKTVLDAQIIEMLPNLKYIGVLATGYNVVDIEAARAKSIVVTNVPAYGTQSVGQMVIAGLLALCHRVESHSEAVMAGKWTSSPDFCFWEYPLIELAGKTIGIVGLGQIGYQVGRLASSFGMTVQAYDRVQRETVEIDDFRWVELTELFETSDVISLNCPLVPETENLINKQNLELMKPSAFLLNAARGGLVIDSDLAEALNTGQIAGAWLDVLSTEPPKANNPLLSAKNILITPHIAWATRESRQRLMNTAVANVKAFLEENPQNVV